MLPLQGQRPVTRGQTRRLRMGGRPSGGHTDSQKHAKARTGTHHADTAGGRKRACREPAQRGMMHTSAHVSTQLPQVLPSTLSEPKMHPSSGAAQVLSATCSVCGHRHLRGDCEGAVGPGEEEWRLGRRPADWRTGGRMPAPRSGTGSAQASPALNLVQREGGGAAHMQVSGGPDYRLWSPLPQVR